MRSTLGLHLAKDLDTFQLNVITFLGLTLILLSQTSAETLPPSLFCFGNILFSVKNFFLEVEKKSECFLRNRYCTVAAMLSILTDNCDAHIATCSWSSWAQRIWCASGGMGLDRCALINYSVHIRDWLTLESSMEAFQSTGMHSSRKYVFVFGGFLHLYWEGRHPLNALSQNWTEIQVPS